MRRLFEGGALSRAAFIRLNTMGETGRRVGDCFREHLRDVGKTTQMRSNRLRAILIFLTTPDYLWGILTPREHRKPKKSRTEIHFSSWYTLSTRN